MRASMWLRRWRRAPRPAWSSATASRPSASRRAASPPTPASRPPAARSPRPTSSSRPQQLDVLAVTGTNGKTSTAWWLAQALSALPPAAALRLVGAGSARLGVGVPPRCGVSTGLTTPDPVLLQQQLARALSTRACSACAIEASSIGIAERPPGRHAHPRRGLHQFHAGPSRLPRQHGGLLGGQGARCSAGRACRRRWSTSTTPRAPSWPAIAARRRAGPVDVSRAGEPARLQAQRHPLRRRRACASTVLRRRRTPSSCPRRLIGHYNVSNLLGVIAAMRALGVPLATAVQACARAARRCPAAWNALGGAGPAAGGGGLRPHARCAGQGACWRCGRWPQQRGGKLWCVFGCGGDRDAAKRPLMGAVADTARRPGGGHQRQPAQRRARKPSSARSCWVCAGTAPCRCKPTGRRPLPRRCAQAAARDVVLLAGKGHEDYQEIAGMQACRSPTRTAGRAGACSQRAAHGASRMSAHDDPAAGRCSGSPVRAWWATARWCVQRVHTRHAHACSPATCSWRSRASASTPMTFCRRRRPRAPWRRSAHDAAALRPAGLPGLVVPDSKLALGQLAAGWRAQFNLPLIAVTGSNGKTTVTQMIAVHPARLASRRPCLATEGNFNNDIGVPLTAAAPARARTSWRWSSWA